MNAEELLSTKSAPWLIAEMGCNHAGDLATARRLSEIAIGLGVDAVKGQMRDVTVDPPAHWASQPYAGPHSYGETYLEHRRALELPLDAHRILRMHAAERGASYSVSVWDHVSAKAWMGDEPAWIKVPSACLTNEGVISVVRESTSTVVMLSTGMHTDAELDQVVQSFPRPELLIILHTTSDYPLANKDVHLEKMRDIAKRYPLIPVGISGHWRGASNVDCAAVGNDHLTMARVIERHVTLDRTMKGTDHAASLEPSGIQRWVRDVRVASVAQGSRAVRRDGVIPCEQAAREKLMGGGR